MTENPPIGGNTDHSHEHSEAVTQAAMWLADQKENLPRTLDLLRDNFGSTPTQAAQACTLANKFRAYRRAHG